MRDYKFDFIKLSFSNLSEDFKNIIKNYRNDINIKILSYIIYSPSITLLI